MPTLNWIGKEKIVNHHRDVPYCVLDRKYSFDKTGQHEEDNGSENMIIHGDNLYALKALLPKYEKKIDCVYIDPPYNTGHPVDKGGWIYSDKVDDPAISKWLGQVVGEDSEDLTMHDKWLCMMYPRLYLIKKLLSENGSIAISIGHHELVNLVEICKEIFTTKQIIPVTVQTSGGKPNGGFNYTQEYIVFIVSKDFDPNPSEDAMKEYASPFHGMNLATFNQVQRPNQAYPIFIDSDGAIIGTGKSLQDRINNGEYVGDPKDFVFDYTEAPTGSVAVWPVTRKGDPCVWRLISSRLTKDWKNGYIKVVKNNSKSSKNEYTIQYLSEGIIKQIKSGLLTAHKSDNPTIPTLIIENYKTAGVNIPTIWTDKKYHTAKGGDEIREIFGDKAAFPYPKPVSLIQDILKYISSENSIVLDSFAGSGTTAQAVTNLNIMDGGNRRYILIEMSDYAETVTALRNKVIIKGFDNIDSIDLSFSYYDLGEPLFTEEHLLNEKIDTEKIREYVWFIETKTPYVPIDNENPYYLGDMFNISYYFYYDPNMETILNDSFFSKMQHNSNGYVIYADACTLPKSTLSRSNIIFKKIPRDISKL